MRVSYVELFNLCKKVFRAYDIPNGCSEDGADVVTWSEFIGLAGMETLLEEMTNIHPSGINGIQLINEEDGLYEFDGNGQSALVLGKLMADYALGAAVDNETVRIYMKNTTRSRLLAQPASYIASRGLGSIVNYKTLTGTTVWILATPEIGYPVFAEGVKAEEIMHESLKGILEERENKKLSSNDFWLVCTTDTTLINSCVRKLRAEARNKTIHMTESGQLRAAFEKSMYYGAEINQDVWNELEKIGNKTLVEATDESRERGAG